MTLADELIRPSVLYTPAVRAAIAAADVHAVAHITGGGFEGNVPRALPREGLRAVLDRGTWEVPAIFGEIRRLGHVADDEMARVFNLGLGMVMVVGPDSTADALAALAVRGSGPRWWAGWRKVAAAWSSPGPAFWPGGPARPPDDVPVPPA